MTTIPAFQATQIANTQSLSPAVPLGNTLPAAITVPASANWTNANVTFQVSLDGDATYSDFYKGGVEYVVVIPTGRTNPSTEPLNPADFAGVTHLKVRSGTGAVPVPQGGNRDIQIGGRYQ